jgi:hypothetical protein
MDQPLQPQQLRAQRRRVFIISALVVLSLSLAGWLLHRLLTPELHRSELRIATISQGDIANTINGAGLVIPVHEAQVASPISTRVSKIHVKPGQTVHKDQLLLELDDHDVQLAIENLREQIAQQDSLMLSLTVDMQQKLKKLHSDIELLQLDLASSTVRLSRFQKLGALGITSQDDLPPKPHWKMPGYNSRFTKNNWRNSKECWTEPRSKRRLPECLPGYQPTKVPQYRQASWWPNWHSWIIIGWKCRCQTFTVVICSPVSRCG